MVAGNIRLLVQQCNRSSFLWCAATTLFLVHDKRCLVSHWPPASEIGMRLITTSWNSAWWPEESECWQLAHKASLGGHAVPWPWEERHGRGWHGRGMASVNQTRSHCVNQVGKTHYKPLAARHAMCESALMVPQTCLWKGASHFVGNFLREWWYIKHLYGIMM